MIYYKNTFFFFKKILKENNFHKILLKFRLLTRDQVNETRGERPCSRES